MYEHFNNGSCDISHLRVQPIEQILDQEDPKSFRLKRESFWIKELRTLTPYGLNDKLDSHNWRFRSRNDIAGLCFNRLSSGRGSRGSGKNRRSLNRNLEQDLDDFLKDLRSYYDGLRNWRNFARVSVSHLKHKELRDYSWKFVELLFDVHTDFPREVTNLVLDMINCRLFRKKEERDSTPRTNFVKVYFQAKDVEKVNLSSIFKKLEHFVPDSLQSKTPTLIYLRSKTIGSKVFNYKKTVEDVITNDWSGNSSFVCDCANSSFCDPHHGHIVSGDLRIIKNRKLRMLLSKGPSYREPMNINWDKFVKDLKISLDICVSKWAYHGNVDSSQFDCWIDEVLKEVNSKIQKLRTHRNRRRKSILHSPSVLRYLTELQKRFVFVPTDKAGKNIAIVCKRFYILKSLQELGIWPEASEPNDQRTYAIVDTDIKSIIKRHKTYMKSNLGLDDIPESFPFLYWIPKMHKKPISKQRYIAASYRCTTKPLSAILTKCLKVIEDQQRFICKGYYRNHGIDPMWILKNSTCFHKLAADVNRRRNARNICTYDFTTLYTSIPHQKLKSKLSWVIKTAFKSSGKSFISVHKNGASWSDKPKKNTLHLDCNKVIRLLRWLIDNIYVTFGDKCFRQVIGIPMGTDCAPFLANLFLFAYEFKWINEQRTRNPNMVYKFFRYCGRYIDDLVIINNDGHMKEVMADIYPSELELVTEDGNDQSCPFLDLHVVIKDSIISTSIFDKRDAFDFPIVNFPTLTGNIPHRSSYGVFIGELVRYCRACTFFKDFEARATVLITKLLRQAFTARGLKASFFKFIDSHVLLAQKYGLRILSLVDKIHS